MGMMSEIVRDSVETGRALGLWQAREELKRLVSEADETDVRHTNPQRAGGYKQALSDALEALDGL